MRSEIPYKCSSADWLSRHSVLAETRKGTIGQQCTIYSQLIQFTILQMDRDHLGVGICFGIGIAGLAVGAILKVYQDRNTPRSFGDYNDMRQELRDSKELVDVVIQGTVEQKNDFSVDDKKGAIAYMIAEDAESIQATILASVPFQLADTNNNQVTVKDIHLAHGFYSLKDTMKTTKTSVEFENIGLSSNTKSRRTAGSSLLEFGSSLAVIGKVMFQDGKKGGDMVFYPRKVGLSVETLAAKKEVLNLNKYSTSLIIGGLVLIAIAAATLYWIIPWIREKRHVAIEEQKIEKLPG